MDAFCCHWCQKYLHWNKYLLNTQEKHTVVTNCNRVMLYCNSVLGGPRCGNHMYKQVNREAKMDSSDNSIIKSPYFKSHFLVFQLGSGIFI